MFDNVDIWNVVFNLAIYYAIYKFGQMVVYFNMYQIFKRNNVDLGKILEEAQHRRKQDQEQGQTEDLVNPMTVDKIGQQYYAYSNGNFLAQAEDFRTLLVTIKSRFPQQKFILEKYEQTLSDDEARKLIEACMNYKSESK